MLIGIVIFFTTMIFWQFLGYPFLMAAIFRSHKNNLESKDYSYKPFVSIIIPTYNEAQDIKWRILNLLSQEYPEDKFEIIIVDSGSTDDTTEIAEEIARDKHNITVLDEGKRKGKASAINLGKSHAKGEIILVTDANTAFDSNTLKEMMPHFKNPKIGAVGGRFIPTKIKNTKADVSTFYWKLESLLRLGESVWGSTCLFHGEINAWRSDIVEADIESLAEDLDMAISINKKGYRISYEYNAIAYEVVPSSKREQIIQKKRSTIGTIQSFFKHKKYLLLPNNKYTWIVFPSHKTLQIFSPFIIFGFIISTTLHILDQINIAIFTTLTILLIFSIALIVLDRFLSSHVTIETNEPEYPLLKNLLKISLYVLFHEYIVLLAWKEYMSKDYTVEWEIIQSTRGKPDIN